MERTDWLDGGYDSVAARFLMVTAITHHRFSSPIWGEDEVRKLHAELAEIEVLAGRAVVDHDAFDGGRWVTHRDSVKERAGDCSPALP